MPANNPFEQLRTVGERARRLAASASVAVRDAFDQQYHLELLRTRASLDFTRDDMVMTDLAFIELKQRARFNGESPELLHQMGNFVPAYARAAWYYEEAGEIAQYQHAVGRLNECFSYILTTELLTGPDEQREAFVKDFCERRGFEPLVGVYVWDRLSLMHMVRMRIKRNPPPLE